MIAEIDTSSMKLMEIMLFIQFTVSAYVFIFFVSKISRSSTDHPEVVPRKLVRLFIHICQAVALAMGIYYSLDVLEVRDHVVSTILGAVFGVGFSFAIRDNVANFISGFLILIMPTYKEGDTIRILDRYGKIVSFDSQHVRLQGNENIGTTTRITSFLIPNFVFYNTVVTIYDN
jgi:small-conductance mechanosensitive channel